MPQVQQHNLLLPQGTTSQPGASDHGCWAEYTTTVSSVSSTDSASHSGKKLCCYTLGHYTSQPQPQAQPQTMVVGQSIPQQYPQSPAQTVPPTQVRNYVVILRGTTSQPQQPSLRPGCWAEYTTTVSSVSSTDSASHSGKKLCCYTRGTPSQPMPEPQTMVVGQSIPQQYPQSPAQTVPPTQVEIMLLYCGTTSAQQPWSEPQTMVVGQSIPQQYPQSPAQTVPPTQVRNYVVILGALLPSGILSPRPASDHGCWAEYTTTVSSVSSTDSASHSGKKLCCYTQGTTSQQPWSRPSLRPWLLGRVYHSSILSLQHRAEAGKECPKYNNIIIYLSGRQCLCWRLRILLWSTLPNNHGLRLGLGLRLGRSAPSITT